MYLLFNLTIATPSRLTNRGHRESNESARRFISAEIHKSLDGTRAVDYVQWKSKDAFDKMLKNLRAILYMNDILSIAKLDSGLYEVIFGEMISK